MQEKSAALKKAESVRKIEEFARKALTEATDHQRPWLNMALEIYDLIDGRVSSGEEVDVHLNQVGTAYERITAELSRGLVNFDKWMSVENEPGVLGRFMTPLEAKRLLALVLDSDKPRTAVIDMIRTSLVENRTGLKIHTYVKELASSKKSFKVKWVPVKLSNYLVDPADPDSPLYEMYSVYMPKYKAARLPYVWKDVIKKLSAFEDTELSTKMLMAGDIDGSAQAAKLLRKDVRIIDFWGTVLDDDGEILTYDDGEKEILLENVQILFANDGRMICEPKPNKRYSKRSPFVMGKLLRSGTTAYRPGLLANGAELNLHMDDLMSSMIAGGLKAGHNVNVVHTQHLSNPEVVANGLRPDTTLEVNGDMPTGAKVFTSEKIGDLPQELIQLYGILRNVTAENMYASDQFMTAATRTSETATSQIQSQNVIGGLFEHLDGMLEDEIIERVTQETFQEALKNRKYISDEELMWVFSMDEGRALAFKEMPEKELLDSLGHAFRFRGKGIRSRAASKARAQAYVQFASMIMGNQLVAQQFLDMFSFKTFLSKGLESLEIDPEELNLTDTEYDLILHRKMAEQTAMAQAQAQAAMVEGGEAAQEGGAANVVQNGASEMPVGQQQQQAM
jgi:hypothetical protein